VDRTGWGHTWWWTGSYEVTPPDRCVQHCTHHPTQNLVCSFVCLGACGVVDRTGWGHTWWWTGSYEVTPPERYVQHHTHHATQPDMREVIGRTNHHTNRGS
jgi:hypothetical protein